MTAEELRAMTAAGPAVIMSSREDFLALLDERDRLRRQVFWLIWTALMSGCLAAWAIFGRLVSNLIIGVL